MASSPGEISIQRPFYPMRPGNAKQWHLLGGLGIEKLSSLLRLCERSYEGRGVASPLFWTLGSKQVGKAAISGWREVLQPALAREGDAIALWPFQGDLEVLISPGVCTIVETYPAEACTHLGLTPPGEKWSKRDQEDRRRQGRKLAQDARSQGARFTAELLGVIEDGFGPGPAGEDAFDALVGLLSMIEVVRGRRSADVPHLRRCAAWKAGFSGRIHRALVEQNQSLRLTGVMNQGQRASRNRIRWPRPQSL